MGRFDGVWMSELRMGFFSDATLIECIFSLPLPITAVPGILQASYRLIHASIMLLSFMDAKQTLRSKNIANLKSAWLARFEFKFNDIFSHIHQIFNLRARYRPIHMSIMLLSFMDAKQTLRSKNIANLKSAWLARFELKFNDIFSHIHQIFNLQARYRPIHASIVFLSSMDAKRTL
jgi:hypothetical protein